MKFSELQIKQPVELHMLLAQYREQLREARFRVNARQLKNVREIRVLRKTIAQILTALRRSRSSRLTSRQR